MDNNKIHWLWFGVVTVLSGVAAWTLSSIIDLRETIKTVATNQVWVIESIKLMAGNIKDNRDLIIKHMLKEQLGEDKANGNGPDPGRHLP